MQIKFIYIHSQNTNSNAIYKIDLFLRKFRGNAWGMLQLYMFLN
jgi:hypothetical protein